MKYSMINRFISFGENFFISKGMSALCADQSLLRQIVCWCQRIGVAEQSLLYPRFNSCDGKPQKHHIQIHTTSSAPRWLPPYMIAVRSGARSMRPFFSHIRAAHYRHRDYHWCNCRGAWQAHRQCVSCRRT